MPPTKRLYATRSSLTMLPPIAAVQFSTPVLARESRTAVLPPLAGKGRLPGSKRSKFR